MRLFRQLKMKKTVLIAIIAIASVVVAGYTVIVNSADTPVEDAPVIIVNDIKASEPISEEPSQSDEVVEEVEEMEVPLEAPQEVVTTVAEPEQPVSQEPSAREELTSEYKYYIPDNYQKVIVCCGPCGLINQAKDLGENRFAIVEIVNFVHSFADVQNILNKLGINGTIVLTGVGSGAESVWALAADSRVSAIVPVSGGPATAISSRCARIPILAIMRTSDPIYVKAAMQDTVRDLKERGNSNASYAERSPFGQSTFDWMYKN